MLHAPEKSQAFHENQVFTPNRVPSPLVSLSFGRPGVPVQPLGEEGEDRIDGDEANLGVAPALVFQLARVQALVADDDPVGDADELHVREHEPWARVPVVQEYLDPGLRQPPVQLLGRFPDPIGLMELHGQ